MLLKHRLAIMGLFFFLSTSFVFGESSYGNPVDGRTYLTNGEFKTYNPEGQNVAKNEKVTISNVRLLTGEPDLKERVLVEELDSFIKSAENEAHAILAKNIAPARVLLQFNCQPNHHVVQIASQGSAQEAVLHELYDKTKALTPLKTSGEVIFQVEFNVSP